MEWWSNGVMAGELGLKTPEPQHPSTRFLGILKFRRLHSRRPHLLRFNNGLHSSQILANRGADQQIIKILPLRDFLAGDGQALLYDRGRIGPAFFEAPLQNVS